MRKGEGAMNGIRWAVLSLVAGLMVWAGGTAEAANIVVPDDFGTIQAAVTAAAAGDTIRIRPGVYFENVVVPATIPGSPSPSTPDRGSLPSVRIQAGSSSMPRPAASPATASTSMPTTCASTA